MTYIEGWENCILISLLKVLKSGGTPDTSRSDFYGGKIPFVTIEDMSVSDKFLQKTLKSLTNQGLLNSNAWIVPKNSLLYSIYATLGLIRINKIPVTTNQAILAMIVDDDKVDRNYLYYWLEYVRNSTINFSSQTTQSNLSSAIVKRFIIQYPKNRKEQAKIATILTTIDSAIEQTEKLIAKQQRIKAGLMRDLLTKGIDEQGNVRSEETHDFKDSSLGRIPVDWKLQTLHEVGTWFSGGTPPKANEAYWNGTIPWVCPKDMKVLDLYKTTDMVSKEGAISGCRKVPENSVFIVVRGMILAHTFPVCISHKEMVFNQDVKAIVTNKKIEARYLTYWFITNSSRLLKLVTASTHGTKRLDTDELFKLILCYPLQKEQIQIISLLDNIQTNIEILQKQLLKIKTQKKALMQDLLTGKVRVTDLLD